MRPCQAQGAPSPLTRRTKPLRVPQPARHDHSVRGHRRANQHVDAHGRLRRARKASSRTLPSSREMTKPSEAGVRPGRQAPPTRWRQGSRSPRTLAYPHRTDTSTQTTQLGPCRSASPWGLHPGVSPALSQRLLIRTCSVTFPKVIPARQARAHVCTRMYTCTCVHMYSHMCVCAQEARISTFLPHDYT